MNRAAILLASVVVFAIAVANVMLGQRLILPLEVVEQRGAGVPWYITWTLVWVSVLCAVVLGVFLIGSTLGKPSRR